MANIDWVENTQQSMESEVQESWCEIGKEKETNLGFMSPFFLLGSING